MTCLRRVVLRFPPEDIVRIDRLAARARRVLGRSVPRAAVVRALVMGAIADAEQQEDFAAKLGPGWVSRGPARRPR